MSLLSACAATPLDVFAKPDAEAIPTAPQDSLDSQIQDAEAHMQQLENDAAINSLEEKMAEQTNKVEQLKQQEAANGEQASNEAPLKIENTMPEDMETADYADDAKDVGEESVQDNAEENPPAPKDDKPTTEDLLAKVAPAFATTSNTDDPYVQEVNASTWYQGMRVNPHTTVKLQILLDWNHASPGPIDKGWGMNSKKALRAFEYMHGFEVDGRMDSAVWAKLTEGELAERDALVDYTITADDTRGPFYATPRGYEAKSKMKRLAYQNIQEMLAERFHMNVNFLRQLNPASRFREGDTIIVVNVGKHNTSPITRVIADKDSEMLYAYHDDALVATYPTTVGSSKTPSPNGNHRVVAKVYMPYYGATSKTDPKQKWTLPPGPNNPVGTVWLALSKPSYGIHGSPKPEGISRQASAGCVRLTNWDAAELYATIEKGAKVEFR